MGETACFIHFSNPSDISHGDSEKQVTRIPDGSISFGRFATDSLAWEKWSSFSHNRYLEEVERYKNPGSVAQKKAYFEAHFKRIAAQRVAKLLEQENAATSDASESNQAGSICHDAEPELDDGFGNGNGVQHFESSEISESLTDQSHIVDSLNPYAESGNCVPVDKPEDVEGSEHDSSFSRFAIESDSIEKTVDSETKMAAEAVTVREEKIVMESQMEIDPSQQLQDIENHRTVSKLETNTTNQAALDIANHSKISKPETNKTNQAGKPPLKESLAANQEITGGNKIAAVVSASKSSNVCGNPKLPPAPPAKPAAPINPRKENIITPNSRRSPWDSVDKKRSNSLHMSLNFAPTPKTNEKDLVLDKIGHSKTSRDGSKSPTKVSSDGAKSPVETSSRLENRREKALPKKPIAQSQKTNRKWFSLSVDCSPSGPSSRRIKSGSKIFSCFNIRSEDNATKRKQEETKLDLKKLRQSLGFKAKPMPDFYHETEPTKNQIKKIPLTRSRSPKLGRKTNARAAQDGNSLPPRAPVKRDSSVEKKRTPERSLASLLNKETD